MQCTNAARSGRVAMLVGCLVLSATASAAETTFRPVVASDRSFSVEIPAPWKVQSAQVGSFHARGPQGQSVAWGEIAAVDYAHFRQMQAFLGPYASMVFPVVAQPMQPVEVIEGLLPRLNRAVQGVHVIGARRVAAGTTGSLVIYRYLLVPALAAPRLRAQIAPSLLAASQVAMQAKALILTNPPNADGIWTIVYWTAESPRPMFDSAQPTFGRIFASLHYNVSVILNMIAESKRERSAIIARGIQNQAAENAKMQAGIAQFTNHMRQMQEQVFNTFQGSMLKIAEGWIDVHGGRQRFVDAQGTEYDVDRQWHSYHYNCESGWGAAARIYGSNTMNCDELAGKYGVPDMEPIRPK